MLLRAADLVLRRRGNLFLPETFRTTGDCFALSGSQRHLCGTEDNKKTSEIFRIAEVFFYPSSFIPYPFPYGERAQRKP